MPLTVGTGAGQYPAVVRHVQNGEPASDTVLKRPSQDLEARTVALKTLVESEETRLTAHDHTGTADGPQLTRASLSDVNVANGICGLDSNAQVPIANLPAAILGDLKYVTSWNASTNSPAIPAAAPASNSSLGNQGQYYVVGTAGSTSIDGETDWKVGDWLVSNGVKWEKIDNTTEPNLQLLNALAYGLGTAGYAIAVKSDGTGYELAPHGPRLDTAETDLGNHDTRLTAIEENTPEEESYTVVSTATNIVTLSLLTWDASNTVLDIMVDVNGQELIQDVAHNGASGTAIAATADFAKIGTSALKFAVSLPVNAVVKVRKPGTFGGLDLQSVAVDAKPATSGAVALGGTTKGWNALYLKDTANSDVYRLQIVSGVPTWTKM